MVAKLFAKHIKLREAIEYVKTLRFLLRCLSQVPDDMLTTAEWDLGLVPPPGSWTFSTQVSSKSFLVLKLNKSPRNRCADPSRCTIIIQFGTGSGGLFVY